MTFGPARAASLTGNWPVRPVRLISTYATGGSSDIFGNPHSILPPTLTANWMIRVLSKLEPLLPTSSFASNDNWPLHR
jgi:hypothetical protein